MINVIGATITLLVFIVIFLVGVGFTIAGIDSWDRPRTSFDGRHRRPFRALAFWCIAFACYAACIFAVMYVSMSDGEQCISGHYVGKVYQCDVWIRE